MLKKQERIKRSSSKYCTQCRSWVTLVSSVFPNAINYFIARNFPSSYLRMKNTGTSIT